MASPTRPFSPLSPHHLNLGSPLAVEGKTGYRASGPHSESPFEDTENILLDTEGTPNSPSATHIVPMSPKFSSPSNHSPKQRIVTSRPTSLPPPGDDVVQNHGDVPFQILEDGSGESSRREDSMSTIEIPRGYNEQNTSKNKNSEDHAFTSSVEKHLLDTDGNTSFHNIKDDTGGIFINEDINDDTTATIEVPPGYDKQASPTRRPVKHESISLAEDALRQNEGLTRAIQTLEEESCGSNDQSADNDMSVIATPPGYDQQQSPMKGTELTSPSEDDLRENEGLTRAIQVLEDENSVSFDHNVDEDTMSTVGDSQGYAGMDDTGFTNFSAVPSTDVTLFPQTRQSPSRSRFNSPAKSSSQTQCGEDFRTPRQPQHTTPASTRRHYDECSPSPTPRRHKSGHGNEPSDIIPDFTEQLFALTKGPKYSPSRNTQKSPRKFHTQPELLSYVSGHRTPASAKRPSTPPEHRHYASLLDFDLTPAPTPRSVPSITARELESLKSSFLSQISSLRAAVSGKDAEINSLKDAVADAERRVGEALEQIRQERGTKESLQAEKIEWEKRDKEMQSVLRNVKEQIIRGDREMDQLAQKLEESERKREEAESKAIEAQTKIASLKAGSAAAAAADGTPGGSSANRSTDAAIEKVAKELHGLYRQKHEVKVAALKESYRARWERKIRELEGRIDHLTRENDDLRLGRDATMSGVVPPSIHNSAVNQQKLDQERAEQANFLADLQKETARVRHDNGTLVTQLDRERSKIAGLRDENGNLVGQLEKYRLEMADLVAATEEMMQLSLNASSITADVASALSTKASLENLHGSVENLRGSVSRAVSGLKQPGYGAGPGESRIGRMGERSARVGFGATAGGGSRSGIMGNIERMGRGRSGD